MSSFELIPLYTSDSQPEANGLDREWRMALYNNPDKLAAFEALDPEGQSLIARRMELQHDLRAAQEEIHLRKGIFDRIVQEGIQGRLVDLEDLEEAQEAQQRALEEAREAQSQAYKYCVQATTSVLDVEGRLCWRGLASAPFLELTLRTEGQALADNYSAVIEPYDPHEASESHGIAS